MFIIHVVRLTRKTYRFNVTNGFRFAEHVYYGENIQYVMILYGGLKIASNESSLEKLLQKNCFEKYFIKEN